MNTAFYSLHPAVSFAFFCMALALSIMCMHPVYAAISVVAAVVFALHIRGGNLKNTVRYMLPIFVLIVLLNPVFNRRGDTVLFYVFGHGFTLEAMAYGLCSGVMFAAVILWFACYSAIISSDKFLYLFGRITPSAALVTSMAIRMVPEMQSQMETIRQAQRMMDAGGTASWANRLRSALRMVSVLLNWTMEDAVGTADSMRARGYGIYRRRTSFALFRMDRRDWVMLGLLLLLSGASWALYFDGRATLYFYPVIRPIDTDTLSLVGYVVYAFLLFMPTLLEWRENMIWRRLRSTI
jgi:energy-coupling factor transport system permease protein